MERQEFHASKFGTAMHLALAFVLAAFIVVNSIVIFQRIRDGATYSSVAGILFLIAVFAVLLLSSWRGTISALNSNKGPIVVLDDDGVHLPSLGRSPIPWQDVRIAEHAHGDQWIYIYLKAGRLYEGLNTVQLKAMALSNPKKLIVCINDHCNEK